MAEDVVKGLSAVKEKVSAASIKHRVRQPRLVAVSKTKPVDLIVAAYEAGQRHFGENYIQELVEKGSDSLIAEKCKEIRWHFIGHLQRNKVNKLVGIPGLYLVETVDSKNLAVALDSAWSKQGKESPLNIMVQVNTSGEEAKSGCLPEDVNSLMKYIFDDCPHLKPLGLMTIGQFGYDYTEGPNPDFDCLVKCKHKVCQEFKVSPDDFELSMGMSDDFEQAIEAGSTNVRVGSSIFGTRTKKLPPDAVQDMSAGIKGVRVE